MVKATAEIIRETRKNMQTCKVIDAERAYIESEILTVYGKHFHDARVSEVVSRVSDVVDHVNHTLERIATLDDTNTRVSKGALYLGESHELFPSGINYAASERKAHKARPEREIRPLIEADEVYMNLLHTRNVYLVHDRTEGDNSSSVWLLDHDPRNSVGIFSGADLHEATLKSIEVAKKGTKYENVDNDVLLDEMSNGGNVGMLIHDDVPEFEHTVITVNDTDFYVCTRDQMYASGKQADEFVELDNPITPDATGYMYARFQLGKFLLGSGYDLNKFTEVGVKEKLMDNPESIFKLMKGNVPMMYEGRLVWTLDTKDECMALIADTWNAMQRGE